MHLKITWSECQLQYFLCKNIFKK